MKHWRAIALLWFQLQFSLAFAAPPVTIGVLSFRPKEIAQAQWQPLEKYLASTVGGATFALRTYDYAALQEAVRLQQIDFVITQPAEYVRMSHQNGLASPLATLINLEQGKPVRVFGGTVVSLSSRGDINQLADLESKRIATSSKGSFGAYQVQAYTLRKAQVTLGDIVETGLPQDRAVEALLRGEVDAAFVRSGMIETLAREGKLDLAQIKVVNRQAMAGYPFAVSTALFPEWPVIAMPHVREELAVRVAGALLSLPHGGAVATSMDIYGFTVPAEYEPVRSMMRELKVPPYDLQARVSLTEIWHQYRLAIVAGLCTIAVIAALGLYSTALGFRLKELNRTLERRIADRTQELAVKNNNLTETLEALAKTRDELIEAEKLAALGSLVAGVAHELNTPIGNGITVATALEEKVEVFRNSLLNGLTRTNLDNFVTDVASAGELLVRSLSRAGTLVTNFKQVAVDRTSARKQIFLLHELIVDVALELKELIQKSGCSLRIDGVNNDIEIDGYPSHLRQVLAALVTNGVDHAFIGRNPGVIKVRAALTGDGNVNIEVADDGVGIPAENLKKVFEPFFTTHLGRGTSGLGLYIVRNMVVGVLGGKISVASSVGHGSTFALSLSAAAPHPLPEDEIGS